MDPHQVSQVISSFIKFPTELQFEVLAAAQRKVLYVPRNETARDAAQLHWNESRSNPASSAFSMRIAPMPHETSPSYRVNASLAGYLNRLYVGGDLAPYQTMDFRGGTSDELNGILLDTVAAGEDTIALDGVLKCEAMGFLLRHGLGTVNNPVGMVDGNPFVGTIDLTISDDFIRHVKSTEGYTLDRFAHDHQGPAVLVVNGDVAEEASTTSA